MEIDEGKIESWMEKKTFLDVAKKAEVDARTEICDELLQDKEIGTHKFEIGPYNVKATKNVNTKLDKDELDEVNEDLSEDEAFCIRIKPELKMGEYKKLAPEERRTLDECIIVTPGAPTLEVK